MTKQILDKLGKEQELTAEEAYYVLVEIIKKAREELNRVPIGNLKKCNQCDIIVGGICERLNLIYFPLTTQALNSEQLYHRFGLIIFNGKSNKISYLIDLSYNQFIKEYAKISPANFFNPLYREQLINDGYLMFTQNIFEDYIKSFELATNSSTKLFTEIIHEFNKFKIPYNNESDYFYENNYKKI